MSRLLVAVAVVCGLAFVACTSTAAAGPIEAIRGKEYRLTPAHGPWMIMVATFHEAELGADPDGLTPAEAAAELVFELRQAGLPAYIYSQDEEFEETTTSDALGGASTVRYRLKLGEVCVLAGNYQTVHRSGEKPSSEAGLYGPNQLARQSLAWVKRFRPAFLNGVDTSTDELDREMTGKITRTTNGLIVRETPGRPTVLSGAFLTVNPLLDPASVREGVDPLLLTLNRRQNNPRSLAGCGGAYSLVVKTFRPSAQIASGAIRKEESIRQASWVDRLTGRAQPLNELDKLAVEAVALADALEDSQVARELGLKTYVWHESDYSIVTLGGFKNRDDPRIAELAKALGAKAQTDPATGRAVIAAEFLPDPRGGDPRNAHGWILDPQPTVIDVPEIR